MPAVVSSVASPSLTVVRSGTSLMKSTHSRATAAKTALIRKMWPVASPYAARTIVRASGPAGRRGPGRRRCWLRAAAAASGPAGAARSMMLVLHPVGQHRAEDRDADRAAEGAEERDGRGGRADVADVDGVLHGEDEVLHHRAHAEAHQRHGDADLPHRGGVVDRAEARPRPATRKTPPPTRNAFQRAGAADDLAGDRSRRRSSAGHQRDGQQAGLGRAVAAGDLEVLAEERRAAEHRDADGDAGDDDQDGGAVARAPAAGPAARAPAARRRRRGPAATAVAPRKAAVCQRQPGEVVARRR